MKRLRFLYTYLIAPESIHYALSCLRILISDIMAINFVHKICVQTLPFFLKKLTVFFKVARLFTLVTCTLLFFILLVWFDLESNFCFWLLTRSLDYLSSFCSSTTLISEDIAVCSLRLLSLSLYSIWRLCDAFQANFLFAIFKTFFIVFSREGKFINNWRNNNKLITLHVVLVE